MQTINVRVDKSKQKQLNDQEQIFVDEYLVSLNPEEAALTDVNQASDKSKTEVNRKSLMSEKLDNKNDSSSLTVTDKNPIRPRGLEFKFTKY